MSKTTELLERAVAEVIANRPAEGDQPSARQRALTDRAFVRVMKIIAPRVRHFIKQYGLTAHWEDAEQVCAIAVHRAIEAYDPAKAMFTTFVNWQIRGELQGLRFRLMDDQRPSAKKVAATTISLHSTEVGPEGEEMSLETMLVDDEAHSATEAAASEHMAGLAADALMDAYVRHLRSVGIAQLKRKARSVRTVTPRLNGSANLPKFVHARSSQVDPEELRKLEERIARDQEIVATYLFASDIEIAAADAAELDSGLTKERIRQVTRRAARVMAELASGNPRFTGENEVTEAPCAVIEAEAVAGIYPASGQVHNLHVTVSVPANEVDDAAMVDMNEYRYASAGSRLRH